MLATLMANLNASTRKRIKMETPRKCSLCLASADSTMSKMLTKPIKDIVPFLIRAFCTIGLAGSNRCGKVITATPTIELTSWLRQNVE